MSRSRSAPSFASFAPAWCGVFALAIIALARCGLAPTPAACAGDAEPAGPAQPKGVEPKEPLALPEAQRYAIPVGARWLDPRTGAVLGEAALDGAQVTTLVDADRGLYRRGRFELDAVKRTSRQVAETAPLGPPDDGPVTLEGTTATIEHDERREKNVLVGRTVDRTDVFRMPLPSGLWGLRVEALGPCFHAVAWGNPKMLGLLVAPDGRVVARRDDDTFLAVARLGDGLLLFRQRAIELQTPEGKPGWRLDLDTIQPAPLAVGTMTTLPGGDVLAFHYEPANAGDSELLRIRPADGHLVWRARPEGFAICHSKYWKEARVEVRGDFAFVIDHEGAGDFVAAFRLADGSLAARWVFERAPLPTK